MEPSLTGSLKLELKYCERRGGLWLRPMESDLVFCAACAIVMAGLAPNSRFLTQHRHSLHARALRQGRRATFWSEGGNA